MKERFFPLKMGWVYYPSVDAYLRWHVTHSSDDMSLESDGGMILTGENRRTRRKTCPSATLSTNPTWIDPSANPGLRGEMPATNDLSHGTAAKRDLVGKIHDHFSRDFHLLRYQVIAGYCQRASGG
jgi:hypothetical protein